MPYTLTMGFIWFALAAMIGLVVGWVLRSATASRQVARGRKQVRKELASEIDHLRERVTTLGRSAEERDRLQVELESLKELHLAFEGSPSGAASSDSDDVVFEGDEGTEEAGATATSSLPDVALGSSVLGRRIVQDDLKAVVGIGPAIERLCHGVGIRTWWDLACAENDTLTSMLADAGLVSDGTIHRPGLSRQNASLKAVGTRHAHSKRRSANHKSGKSQWYSAT